VRPGWAAGGGNREGTGAWPIRAVAGAGAANRAGRTRGAGRGGPSRREGCASGGSAATELWRAGEPEEARDALRYALQGCGDNMYVHVALGRIALEASRDPTLARGHFGFAFELAERAIPRGFAGQIPRHLDTNRPLYEAIDGLVACYEALKQPGEAAKLRGQATRWAGGGGAPGRGPAGPPGTGPGPGRG